MIYEDIVEGKFVDRPNRFIAHVEINGQMETVHVKNTGRCKELLLPGVKVVLEKASNPNRKTKYDLVAVYKKNFGLINMDSQAPNKVVAEWLSGQDFSYIKHFIKDMRIAIETAHEAGLVLPGLEKAKELYDQLAAKGMENKGTQAIIQWYLNK